jgi:hypothetical protein
VAAGCEFPDPQAVNNTAAINKIDTRLFFIIFLLGNHDGLFMMNVTTQPSLRAPQGRSNLRLD